MCKVHCLPLTSTAYGLYIKFNDDVSHNKIVGKRTFYNRRRTEFIPSSCINCCTKLKHRLYNGHRNLAWTKCYVSYIIFTCKGNKTQILSNLIEIGEIDYMCKVHCLSLTSTADGLYSQGVHCDLPLINVMTHCAPGGKLM